VTTNDRPAIINDRYQLIKRIGRGGMADVFLAQDRLLDRSVAIKMLFAEFAVDPNFVERFRREAQAAANLSHPNVVNVFDWGKHGGTYFIAMEYVEGRTLADILRSNGHLTSKQAAEIASEVAAALGFAHAAGLVHRDIKPANILIGTNGSVKVADFGIARALNAPTEQNLTQAGAVMGTATYFSPEQAQGAQPDPRSDLYSLGVVMYEMIAGRPPFTGDNPVSIAYKQVHDYPTPLNKLVADVPRPYEAIVAKLLTKDPHVRYSTADALREDLRRFRSGERPVALQAAAVRNTAQTPTMVGGAVASRGGPDPQAAQRTAVQGRTGGPRPGGPNTGRQQVALPNRYKEQPRTGWYALAAFFALVALGLGGFLLFNTLTGSDDPSARELPDYRGDPLAEVTADLTRRGITFQLIEEANESFDEGIVHRTDPGAGTVIPESGTVRVFHTPDETDATIPEVTGLSVADARNALTGAGFTTIEQRREENDEVGEGLVIGTEPAEGSQVSVQASVVLVVSSGGVAASSTNPETTVSDEIPVPYVIGQTEGAARAALGDFNVTVTYIEVQFGDDDDGQVMSQSISANDTARPGDAIEIAVGDAADAPPVTNPPPTNPPQTNPPPTNPPPTNPPPTNPPPTNPPPTNPPTPAPTSAQPTSTSSVGG